MTHSQHRTLLPSATAALHQPTPPESSIYATLAQADEPLLFEVIVERVQAQRPATRGEIAAALAALINKRRVFLNQERTGFVAVREREAERFLQRSETRVRVYTPRARVA